MLEISMLTGAPKAPASATRQLLERVTDAGNHVLLRRLRSGAASTEEVSAWLICRCCLAEHLAKKEVLVLAKAGDREGRRLWVQRVLALDGHGDFYGTSKHGLIETWKRLRALRHDERMPLLPSADLMAHLEPMFEQHLKQVRDASWMESLGMTLVDDWVVQNDLMTAGLLPSTGDPMRPFGEGVKSVVNPALPANTIMVLDAALANATDHNCLEHALTAVDARVEFEHAILAATQAAALPY